MTRRGIRGGGRGRGKSTRPIERKKASPVKPNSPTPPPTTTPSSEDYQIQDSDPHPNEATTSEDNGSKKILKKTSDSSKILFSGRNFTQPPTKSSSSQRTLDQCLKVNSITYCKRC